MLELFKMLIREVGRGFVGNLKWVAWEVSDDELEKYKKQACEEAADALDAFFGTELPREAIEEVRQCRKDTWEVLHEYGIEPDMWLTTIREKQAEILMRKLLSKIPDAPRDPQVSEEPGYGLPEYSLYWGADARSYSGRWSFDDLPDDICWGFIADEKLCDKISEINEKLYWEAMRRGNHLLFAVWED